NKLNIVLNSLKIIVPQFDVALASTHSHFNSKQEVATENQFFKSPEDLFRIRREKLIEDLMEDFGNRSLTISDFSDLINERKKAALKEEDFILYKTLLLLAETLTFYGEFQTTVDSFTLKVLKMILELNSPRVSLVTLNSDLNTRLFEINELPYKENEHPLVLIASSNYGPLKSGEGKYSEKMIEALKVIAPIKRSGLDFSYLKSELIQTLSSQKNILLMEEGLELVDLAWREIIKGFDLEVINPEAPYLLKEKKDYLADKIKPGPYGVKNFSASRLQTFIDCPRKYYFSYVEKIDHRPEERLKIAADEMGTIEHNIIEKYFADKKIDSNLEFDPKEHEKLCQCALNDFISKHKILLSEKVKLTTFYELLHYSQNGIEFLINFCKNNLATIIEFERSLGDNPWGLVGSIDCLIHLPDNHIALFDFKRSGAAIGSKRDTLAFDKIQIWTYLLLMIRHRGKKIHSWGYLNLSEIDSSQTYNEIDSPLLSEKTLDDFQGLLMKTIEGLKAEKRFQAVPRIHKICDFCEVQLFCDKGSCVS
ncbi:MAG: PD-(D/E)XK nuclease family protein, partial [Bacteriovorax sp.]